MPTIALIEDNPDNRLLAVALLEDLYEVLEFADGPVALEAMNRLTPDLVLLDISLPGMDGVEVLGRIRAIESMAGVPVVALTAHAMAADRERFLALGFDGYVTKPIVDENVLLGTIADLLGGR